MASSPKARWTNVGKVVIHARFGGPRRALPIIIRLVLQPTRTNGKSTRPGVFKKAESLSAS